MAALLFATILPFIKSISSVLLVLMQSHLGGFCGIFLSNYIVQFFPIFRGGKWDHLKPCSYAPGYKIFRQLFDTLNIEVSITILPARVSCR